MPARPAVDLIAEGHHHRQQRQAEEEGHDPVFPAHDAEHQEGNDHHHEKEAGAAAGMLPGLGPDVLHRQGQALLIAGPAG